MTDKPTITKTIMPDKTPVKTPDKPTMTDEDFNELKAYVDSFIEVENKYNLPKKRFTQWKRNLVNSKVSVKTLDIAKLRDELKPMHAEHERDLAKIK